MTVLKLPFFSRGEISPKLYGRVDTAAYQSGLRTARNAIVDVAGGVMNRPGTVFIGTAKYRDKYTRLIPFAFKVDDTHMLEFGDGYMRVIREDFYQTALNPKGITGITKAAQGIVTCPSHGFSEGDEVRITDVAGMVEVNKGFYIVGSPTSDTFVLISPFTGNPVNTGTFSTYLSGGFADLKYEIETPYAAEDLPLLKYAQSADVLTLTHPSYPIYEVKRFGLNDWRIEEPEFVPSVDHPTNLAVTVNNPSGTDLLTTYQVTAISDESGIESLVGVSGNTFHISNITKSNPAVVTATGSALMNGDEVFIHDVEGMVEINNRYYKITDATTDTFKLVGEDSTNYGAFTASTTDSLHLAFVRVTGSETADNTITWNAVDGADRYGVFKEKNGVFGFIGETTLTTFRDQNILPDLTDGPPKGFNPFRTAGNYPGAVGFFQQRRVFGGSDLAPDTWYASQPGDFNNFTRSFPLKDDDLIQATLASGQVNQIKHFSSSKVLGIFTSGSEWSVSSGGEIAFSPFTVTQVPETNWGCAEHRPYTLGDTIMFVQEDNRTVRSFGFELEIDGYKSSQLSLLSDHIFKDYEIKDWALARTPYSALFFTRTDGQAAMMVFDQEQSVIGWTRWDTKGDFETVGVVRVCLEHETPEPDDGIYLVVKRKVDGVFCKMVERVHKRRFNDIRDAFFVDCGSTFDRPYEVTNVDVVPNTQELLITVPDNNYSDNMVVDFSDIQWEPSVDSMGNETNPQQINDTKFIIDGFVNSDTFYIKYLGVDTDRVLATDFGTFQPYKKGGVARENIFEMYNLNQLEGQTVSILADGFPIQGTVVQDGRVTLPGLASRIHVGLPYTCDIETLNIEPVGSGSNTVQGLKKKINKVVVRFDRSRECLIGPNNLQLAPMKRPEYVDNQSQIFTGDREVILSPDWNSNGRVFFRQTDPMPINILGVYPDLEITNNR